MNLKSSKLGRGMNGKGINQSGIPQSHSLAVHSSAFVFFCVWFAKLICTTNSAIAAANAPSAAALAELTKLAKQIPFKEVTQRSTGIGVTCSSLPAAEHYREICFLTSFTN